MKIKLLSTFCLLSFWQYTFSQKDNNLSPKHSISIEVGYSTSIFLDKNIDLQLFNEFWPTSPTFISTTYTNKPHHYSIHFDYKVFGHTYTFREEPNIGNVVGIQYHAFDIGIGRIYNVCENLLFEPFFMASARPSGSQLVFISGQPLFHVYRYKSMGFGAGFNIKYLFLKHFIVGLEMQYNYYFEKKHLGNKPIDGYEEFERGYKINRQMLTPIIKLGYQFNLKTKKPSLQQHLQEIGGSVVK